MVSPGPRQVIPRVIGSALGARKSASIETRSKLEANQWSLQVGAFVALFVTRFEASFCEPAIVIALAVAVTRALRCARRVGSDARTSG